MIQAETLRAAAHGGTVLTGEPMRLHTTFRAGGPADFFVIPRDEEGLRGVVAACREADEPFYLIGNGSNLLVSDDGYRGVIIRMGEPFAGIRVIPAAGPDGGAHLAAGAGALLSAVAKRALDEALSGLEFAAGIPGSVGGAAVMNAGAYGGEMKQVICSVRVLTESGEYRNLSYAALNPGYRYTKIPEQKMIVVGAEFVLAPGDRAEIRAKMDDLAGRRREKQPLEYPSAGSTFRRPEGYFAGKLIQDAGLRGYRVGGAMVSEKHCGFVINRDHATAAEILKVMRDVQDRVYADSGVRLEPEVKLLGF